MLCVANWSEGRNNILLAEMRARLRAHGAAVHFDGADPDHNRIVTAFSGSAEIVQKTLFSLAEEALGTIDMREHEGVHPRIGALDVCPFIVLEGEAEEALSFAKNTAEELATRHDLPIFLYEKSESGKHAADLPSLRKGQFEGLLDRPLNPDFGPDRANPRLGATVLGVRDWLIAMNVNLPADKLTEARSIAGEMRVQRDLGDVRFSGVRSLGLPLKRRSLTQISMNLTMPDAVSPDFIIQWIGDRETVVETELIGVIRESDLPNATMLPIHKSQIVRVDI
ncbi:MAG: glutamate formiminotransferase [Fimbriimonadales bacterium]